MCTYQTPICPTYWCVCSHQFTKVGNGERMFHWVCGFRVEGSLFKANLQDDQWDRCLGSGLHSDMQCPQSSPGSFPCSMIAKSLQPQNARQLLWAVSKRNYILTHTCTRSCYKNNYFSIIHQCIISTMLSEGNNVFSGCIL